MYKKLINYSSFIMIHFTCLGIPLASATMITIKLPKAIVNNQEACITDCILAGA